MEQYRINVKTFLRDKLTGKDNIDIRERFMRVLDFTNENIKGYINLNVVTCPPFTKFPEICNFFNITLYDLLGITDPSELSTEERELINNYRNKPELKQAVKNIYGMK